MCNQFTVNLNVSTRNVVIEIDRSIKNKLIEQSQKVGEEWYFEYGYYIIRTHSFISRYYGTNYDSFFKETIVPPKSEILKYLNVAREYVMVHIIQENTLVWCECDNPSMEEYDNDICCSNCGRVYDHITPNSFCFTSNKSVFTQVSNINKSLKEIEGSDPIDKDIEELILEELKKRKINIGNLKHETIFLILKDKELNKYYKSINSIYNYITLTNPIIISDNIKKLIVEDYNKFESIYPLIKDASRINSINMKFVLYKLLSRHNIVCYGSSVLRTEIKYQEHEQLWEEGCKMLSWD